MKLNANLIFENLPHSFYATMSGQSSERLSLRRPELLESGTATLRADHLYVAVEGAVTHHLDAEHGAVLICIGESRRLARLESRCCVITVRSAVGLPTVFNSVQSIFNRYDEWEEKLESLLTESASIQEMLEASLTMLPGALFAIDANFHYLGYADASETNREPAPNEEDNLSLEQLGIFFSSQELHMDVAKAFPLEVSGVRTLNVNLLDNGIYRGCVTMLYEDATPRGGDAPILEKLAGYILKAERELLQSGASGSSIRTSLQDLLNGISPDTRDRDALRSLSHGQQYACLRLHLPQRTAGVPANYVCGNVERAFGACWAFENDPGSIVAVADVSEAGQAGVGELMRTRLLPILKPLGITAGVSDVFGRLEDVLPYYSEANMALELGDEHEPSETIHLYDGYRLASLISNALGDLPLELQLTPGLRALMEHDAEAPVSYVDTLRCYLGCGMSATAAARKLYISRSTLLERIERIESLLGTSLEDPDERLLHMILLKALQIQEESELL